MTMGGKSVALVVLASIAGCAGPAKFQPGRPVDIEQKGLGNVYTQGGQPVNVADMLTQLQSVDAARADASTAKGWLVGAQVLSGVGGFGVGYGLVAGANGNKSGWALAGAGAVLAGIGLGAAHAADARAERAVRAYNAGSSVTATPFVAPVADRAGKATVVLGMDGRF